VSDNLSKEATELVREGRQALRPTDADKARVFAALNNRIAGVDAPPQAKPQVDPAAPSTGLTAGKLTALTVGVVAAVTAAVLYGLNQPVAPLPTVVATAAQSTEASPQQDVPGSVSELPDDLAAPTAPNDVQNAGSASSRTSGRDSDSSRLAEEVALLTRAEKEFHSGNLKQALASVDEHRRKFPKGKLVQERVNLRMQVLCGLGRDAEAEAEQKRFSRLTSGKGAPTDVCRRGK
jgi:hypothetical protein